MLVRLVDLLINEYRTKSVDEDTCHIPALHHIKMQVW